MTDDLAKQSAYEVKRRSRVPATHATVEYRVTFRDGSEKIERVIGLSQIVAHWPHAVQITRCDWGGFY